MFIRCVIPVIELFSLFSPTKTVPSQEKLFSHIEAGKTALSHDHFLIIDPDGPLDICEIKIPYFPTTNEVVEFQEGDQTKLMRVIEVAGSCVRGVQLRKVRGSQRWVPGDRMQTLVLNCIRRFDYSINCGHILLNTHSCP